MTGVDLGFSAGGGAKPSRRGRQPTILPKISKKPHEIEKIMDPPLHEIVVFTITKLSKRGCFFLEKNNSNQRK